MKTARRFPPFVSRIGFALLITAMALTLFLLVTGIALEGPGGFAVAILCGCGLSVLLCAVVARFTSVAAEPTTNNSTEAESDLSKRSIELRVWPAKFAVCYSTLATILAIALYATGVPIAFIGFNFARGTNDFGFIVIASGMVVGVVAIICGLVALVLSAVAAIKHGQVRWILAAIAIAAFQVATLLVIRQILAVGSTQGRFV